MLNDWIRRTGFWMLDFMRGRVIRKNYIDVKRRMEQGVCNQPQLERLLVHACKSVPYYKTECHPNCFKEFPVINKNLLKSQWEEMHSEEYCNKPVHYMATSGSTGTPFVMEWDMGK